MTDRVRSRVVAMDPSSERELRDLRDPLVVAAFDGWNDAGSAASAAVDHLAETCDAELAFALDPDDFYDFQVNRPQVELAEDGERTLLWPTTELHIGRLRSGRDLLLVRGPEPNMRWRQFTALLSSALSSANVTRVHLLCALLADVPHTRPIPVSTSSSTIELGNELGLLPSRYVGPTVIVGVLSDSLGKIGVPCLSLWAAVPAYVAHPPCPKATYALLSQLERLIDAPLDFGDLPDLAKAWERGVNELAAEDSEVAEYVSNLEASQDATELPEASGDAIAAEFERYLRRRGGS